MRALLFALLLIPSLALAQGTLPPTQGVALWSWNGSAWVPVGSGSGGTPAAVATSPAATTPAAGTASAIVTGGAATTLVTGPVKGCYIVNPLTATEQNIAAAEVAQINAVTTAVATGRGTNATLQPGQSFSCVPGQTTNVSAIAATTAHAFTVVVW